MSFVTTATDTGKQNGARILLEQKMDKDTLWLGCALIFKRLKLAWNKINRNQFVFKNVNITDNALCFILNHLKEFQTRENYKVLLKLSLIFLEGIS